MLKRVSASSLTVFLLLLAGTFPASALPAQTPDATWMVSGSVRALELVNGVMWIGGKFTQMRSDSHGTASVAVNGLAALDAATGLPIIGLHLPMFGSLTGAPYVFDLSSSGGVMYVGGRFDSVDGQTRVDLAAIDPATGLLLPFRAPDALRKVETVLAAPGGGVYVAGNQPLSFFDSTGKDVKGFVRQKTSIAPGSPNGASFRDIEFAPDGSLFVAGAYDALNGEPHHVVAKVNATTGDVDDAWHLGGSVGVNAVGVKLALDAANDAMYAAIGGSDYVARYRISDGAQVWKRDTSGASQAVAQDGLGNLIVGGHFQWFSSAVGQMCGKNTAPTFQCPSRLRLAAVNQDTGALDPNWAPDVTPLYLGIFAIVVDGTHVHLGGDFKAIEGVTQLFYARLS
jgi:outer membrane protein assembly factor BamB